MTDPPVEPLSIDNQKDKIEQSNNPEQATIIIEAQYPNRPHWPKVSRNATAKPQPPLETTDDVSSCDIIPKINGKYEEIPNLLDGFRMVT